MSGQYRASQPTQNHPHPQQQPPLSTSPLCLHPNSLPNDRSHHEAVSLFASAVCKQCNACAIAALLLSLTLCCLAMCVVQATPTIRCAFVCASLCVCVCAHCVCMCVSETTLYWLSGASSDAASPHAYSWESSSEQRAEQRQRCVCVSMRAVPCVCVCACAYFALSAFLGVRVFQAKDIFQFLLFC